MKKAIQTFTWIMFGFLCTTIGLYPLIYFLIDRHFGLLSSKSEELLHSIFWNTGFYGHIVFGGIALLIGWTQFSTRLRLRRVMVHRTIGKIYLITVTISGTCAVFIGFFATGGIISSAGFICLGLVWLSTTWLAYTSIRKGNSFRHEYWMVYSYAACFAAVTLRLWLPALTSFFGEFNTAYRIVAWLCWVPNIIVAFFIVNNKKIRRLSVN